MVKSKIKKIIFIIVCILVVSIGGCTSNSTEVPNKTKNIKKIEKIVKEEKINIKIAFFGGDDDTGYIRGIIYAGDVIGFFDEDNMLRSVTYFNSDTTDPKSKQEYCVYGNAEECYTMWDYCDKDNTCDELKKQGVYYFKKDYENFLKKYDLTTKDLKEYLEYEYLKEVAKFD